jgi:uncharacterized membrane protein YbaN (DUF454 family)
MANNLILYKLLGFLFVGLGAIGVILPILPTTPFLILAAGCFAKSSHKWHSWLLNNKTFGGLIRDWQEHRSISLKSKILAITMLLMVGCYSVFFALKSIYLQVLCASLISYGLYFIGRIKVKK